MISIVDYGLGNIQAFLNVFKRLNVEAKTARTAAELQGAERVILPGVGHFDHAMEQLDASGMRGALDELVLEKRVPALGICVGMQMLGTSSSEGKLPGLGWIPGRVKGFDEWEPAKTLPLPHMGWNDVKPKPGNRLFSQLEDDARFYFLHSFFFQPEDTGSTAAVANYGADFSCAVSARNIYGVQFHPEKSHHFGERLLKNFAKL
jgi:imidazole glycerol-phosphate synthase subunit HisH